MNELLARFYELIIAGGVSMFGGIAAYVYRISKTKEPFSFKFFFSAAFLAFFIGNMAGNVIPQDSQYRDGFFMLCGFLSYPILSLIESDGMRWLQKFLPFKNDDSSTDKRGE